ncbi:4-alpha-glucanotransferase [Rhodopseudomonas thermotolerans]|uniref:4-alpha-glucanotransferase n=2 Tax=Rhodopseudomonas TaxID=1073 RepID=A0A336JR53_9BRAD|nr:MULTISPECIES: 4-alpha-glucanotransferase [Rhodopseudomonas]RED30549.1 4-alpha-glucanotransferase [Rhodopseudomonas pentothenatexigens]REF92653.1 4-alpha-glucanotransferase [Rhodopseudomonas thermotolerans]SSW92082.1 4-alpha-glucanotransferase [Rhodopseudomonas pentothenatexigens]
MDLFTRAAELGIQTEFYDGQGHRHITPPEALALITEAMPQPAERRLLDRIVVIRRGETCRSELGVQAALPVRWRIIGEAATLADGVADERSLTWPQDLPPGSYRLRLSDASGHTEEQPLLVAPPQAYGGAFDRSWLVAVQLYSLRSGRNWGIGDFTDLANLIELAAALGAGGIGLNPLHALFDDRPGDCSPYSPNSRLFLNPLYVDVERLPEFSATDRPVDAQTMAALRDGELIDYAAVAAVKWRGLRAAFETFCASASTARRAAFEAFRRERAPLLTRFACFEVLRHKFGHPWWDWPEEWRRPDDARCAELRAGPDGRDVEFVEFAQWCADDQLRGCRDLAAARGMNVGLYLDVAVGVQSDGFDAWNEQTAISRLLAVGAPPDSLNTAGQNWGLAGFNAPGLELTGFAPFREMLRASMRYAGAIRLDHVLGLNRLYLVPHGFAAHQGVYVQMPFEALLAVTAQESVAHRCVVIGEDLGTVPDGFRDRLAAWGIWSYRVMMFERDFHQGWFFGLDHYLPNALVTFNTHDLATYSGWRASTDLHLKRSIGVDPGESDDSRRHALAMLGDALRHQGIEQDDIYAVLTFLARTPSRLLAIALEDLLGVLDQPNVPGTVSEHPNWRRRLPKAIEDIAAAINRQALLTATADRRSAG